MKKQPILLTKYWRIWLAVTIIMVVAMACGESSNTSPPPVEPRTEVPVQPAPPEPTEELPIETPLQPEPQEPTEEPPTEVPPTEASPTAPPPAPTTGTISGMVEFSGRDLTIAPIPDTIVEIAGWENTYWAKTNANGEYSITGVPPGTHWVIPQSNAGLTGYQAVNVAAGQVAIADFRILSALPLVLIKTRTIDTTITVDGIPVTGAYMWMARSNKVYKSDQNGDLSYVYVTNNNNPVVVVYNNRWEILRTPPDIEKWEIELSRIGNPPPLPDNMVLIEDQQPTILFLPTPPRLFVLPDLQPQEDCIGFQVSKATVEYINGRWKIVVGRILLLDFGDNQQEAQKALKIIQYYGLNQQCFVGRPDPSMEYYLIDGKSPSGSIAGEDCIGFNPDLINVENVGGRWKITEGSHWLMDFNDQEAEARNAYNIVQKYKFNNFCFVGRPDPSLIYFRQ